MTKNSTNNIIWLTIIGFVLAWIFAGLAAGFTSNLLIGVAMFLIMFSGVFGKKPMTTISGIVPFAAIIFMVTSGTLDDWWKWIICVLFALFVANALSNFRPNFKNELLEYENELKYNLVSSDDYFSIMFPKKPRLVEIGKDLDPNDYTRMYQYNYRDSASFDIYVSDMDEMPKTKGDLVEVLESELSSIGYGFNVTSPEYTKSEILGVACIDSVFQKEDGTCFYNKIFLKKHKKYVIQLAINPENDALFNRFVGSFKFIC